MTTKVINRIKLLEEKEVSDKSKRLLGNVKKAFGNIPNVFKMMANSSAVLDAYLKFSGALKSSKLDAKSAEQIAVFTANKNDCEYCLAVHSYILGEMGANNQELISTREGISSNPKNQALLTFVDSVLAKVGKVSDEDLNAIRAAGFCDEEILEIVANISLNIFTNSLNNLAEPKLDFPIPIK
jgi:uncharacterized peroxidase-related enzyme